MRRKRKKNEPPENLDRWLLTYADMITLLLAFFIVMYSMSRIDAKKFGKVVEALSGILRGGDNITRNIEEENLNRGHGLLKLGNLKMLQQQVQSKFKILGKDEEVQTEITERGLVIHILESALFDEGSPNLRLKALDILDIVYEDIKDKPNHIRIEGHTDNRNIETVKYPSNWELSAARATEVVRYFIESHQLKPSRISALGYGEYRPIRPNNTIENRAQNRRVDIVVLTMELSLKEPSSQLYEFTKN